MIFPVAGQPATRLVSAPSPSPLACVAVWASGKDKRHKIVKAGQLVGEHRYSMLPRFKDGRQSTDVSRENKVAVGSRCSGLLGPCMCLEHEAWKVVVDRRWTSVGIGKDCDGRWVVEFVAGYTGRSV